MKRRLKKAKTPDMPRDKNKLKMELAVIFIISVAIFSLPSLLRWTYFSNPSTIGFPTYMHQRQAQDILNGINYDHLSFGGREYTYPPLFSRGIALFALALPVEIGGIIFVVVFGAISSVFFYLIVRDHISKKYAFLSSVFLILLPGTIYFNSHLSSRAPPFALGMAALYFLLKKIDGADKKSALASNKNIVIAGTLLGIAALFHPETAMFFGVVALFRAAKYKKIFLSFLIAAAIASAYYAPFLAAHGLPEANGLHEEYITRGYSLQISGIQNFFFEISPDAYITFAIAGLAIFGMWKKKHPFLAYWLLLALALGIIAERFLIYLAVPVALLAVYSFIYLDGLQNAKHFETSKKTKFLRGKKLFKTLIALVFIYSIILASSKILYFANSYPTTQQYSAMLWLKNNTEENATILSDWQWGHWISGIAERRNFIDGYAEYAPNVTQRINELENFYRTCEVPQGYNISHIYMEQWFLNSFNVTCMGKFPVAYNNSGLLVYKA